MQIPAWLKNKSLIWSSVGVLVLLVGIIVALQLIPQEQDIREEAAKPTGTTQIKISPTSMDLNTGEENVATVSINTMTTPIRAVSAVLSYPYVGEEPSVISEDLLLLAPFNDDPWDCDFKSIKTQNQQVRIEVGCRAGNLEDELPDGYSTNGQFVDFFKFTVRAGDEATTTPVSISFNETLTVMTTVTQNPAETGEDIAAIPTTRLSVTVDEGPAPEKKITVATPSLSCSANDFTVTAEVTEGTAKKPDIGVTFKYNSESKIATSSAQGVATTTFTRASTTQTVTAEAAGYTSGSAPANVPNSCGAAKTFDLSLSGLACGASDFTVKAKAKDSSATSLTGIGVVFTYNGETKNATTNSSGEAEVKFNRASSNIEVKVEAGAFETKTATVTLPTGCTTTSPSPTTTTTGLSCNQGCSATRECRSGLSCVSGYCRASQCSSDTTCGCADLDVAGENGTTELPESGFDQTLAMTILGLLFLLGGGQLWWSRRAVEPSHNEDQD